MLCEFADFIETLTDSLLVIGAGLGGIVGAREYRDYLYSRAKERWKYFEGLYREERSHNQATWAAEQGRVRDKLSMIYLNADNPALVQQMAKGIIDDLDGKAEYGYSE